MEKWYLAKFCEIKEIEIERATDKFVILTSGRRGAIDSNWMWYRRDREQAKMAMIAKYEKERDKAKRELDRYERIIAEAHNA